MQPAAEQKFDRFMKFIYYFNIAQFHSQNIA